MSRKTLIISDVTAMKGSSVCIAGYDISLRCIRPVLSVGQIKSRHLFKDGELIIYPGAKVSFLFRAHNPHPPHVEDYIFDEDSIEPEGKAGNTEWKKVLNDIAVEKLSELFPEMKERYVPHAARGPSMGTLIPKALPILSCDCYGTPRPKIEIIDHENIVKKKVPITDLAFRSYFHYCPNVESATCSNI